MPIYHLSQPIRLFVMLVIVQAFYNYDLENKELNLIELSPLQQLKSIQVQ